MADQATEGLLSPFLKRQRLAAVRPFLKGRVLDVGCGNGALAAFVPVDDFVGIDIDPVSVAAARRNFPSHDFREALSLENESFDTVTALAVIEHVKDAVTFLRALKRNLRPEGWIVCTTPHPAVDQVHFVGARVGLFSASANKEHEDLLGRSRLVEVGQAAGLRTVAYRRFLLGANQVVAYAHAQS